MATRFSEIYDKAVFRFADYNFLSIPIETREEILERHLISAKTDFKHVCKKADLDDYDKVAKQFNDTLDDEMIEILACGVAFYWISYKTLDSENLKNILCNKDYYTYSPATLLKEIQLLRTTLRQEFQSSIRKYSFKHSDTANN